MGEFLDSKLNVMMLSIGGYFYFRQGMAPIKPPDDAWFQANVIDRPVLVKFGAPWCGPCRMLDPVLTKLAGEGDVEVVRIDIGDHPDLARHYRVSSIPRLFLLDHGKVLTDRVGYADLEQLQSWVASAAANVDRQGIAEQGGESPPERRGPAVVENPFASVK